MSTVVIMPGGFHPFHAGHMALYNSAREAFPDAEVFVAATNDTKTRPFPFAIKEKLAKVAGVQPGHFVQVKSPFQPKEITQNYNPDEDVVIFVRSQKDMKESPIPGGFKKNGEPAYFQPFKRGELEPFGKHAYMAYLPTVEFGPGITSATEIRNAWPKLDDKRKIAMVMSLYPATQKNPKLAANVVQMLDMAMGNELTEGDVIPFKKKHDEDDDSWIPSIEDFEQEERIRNRIPKVANDIDESVGDIYSSRQLGDIANNLGNGYVLVDDSYDDDDGFVKAMYGVYHQEGEDQYRFVGWVNTRSSYRYTQDEFNQAVQDLVDNDKQQLKEFAPTSGDDREPDEEEILRQLAAQWWNGTEQQMKKAQQTLQAMGWEIGQDESGDDDAGVFVIRIGDENGDSYIAFNHSDLNLNEYNVRKTKKFIQRAHDKEQGQMYGNQPYSSHPKAVAAIGKKFFGSTFDSEAVKVALLHDVLEDTPYTPEQLSQKGFSNEVIKAVQLLTKNKLMSYADNIRAIISSGNKLAMMVKYCDNYMNYTGDKSHWDSDRAERSQKKYLASLNMLGDVLGIKKHIGDKETNVTESMDYLEEK
jgi:glycerol-3-phosphate cytidylyltransferase-like family protein